VLIFFFGGYILLTLCVCAISKKNLKTKRKSLFDLKLFYLSRGKEKGKKREEPGEKKQRKSNTLTSK